MQKEQQLSVMTLNEGHTPFQIEIAKGGVRKIENSHPLIAFLIREITEMEDCRYCRLEK